MTEVNLKAKAETSVLVLVELPAGNVLHTFFLKKLDWRSKDNNAQFCNLYRDTNKHKPATGWQIN